MGSSEASFYVWKKRFAPRALTELKGLRQPRDENAWINRLLADLTLDKHILGEVVAAARARTRDLRPISACGTAFVVVY
jgi:putative transposase